MNFLTMSIPSPVTQDTLKIGHRVHTLIFHARASNVPLVAQTYASIITGLRFAGCFLNRCFTYSMFYFTILGFLGS